jgi:hypothetical protein
MKNPIIMMMMMLTPGKALILTLRTPITKQLLVLL